jgi:hypothetical protein
MNGYPWFKCRREPWHELINSAEKPLNRSVALQDLEALKSANIEPTKAELCRRWGWSRSQVRWLLEGLKEGEKPTTTPRPFHDHSTTIERPIHDQSTTTGERFNLDNRAGYDHSTTNPRPEHDHSTTNPRPLNDHPVPIDKEEIKIKNRINKKKASISASEFGRAVSLWKEHRPKGPKLMRSKGGGKLIAARIKDHGIDAVIDVLTWALTSDHRQALWLRDNGYCRVSTLCNASKFEGYLESAQNAEPSKQRGAWTDYDDKPTETPF